MKKTKKHQKWARHAEGMGIGEVVGLDRNSKQKMIRVTLSFLFHRLHFKGISWVLDYKNWPKFSIYIKISQMNESFIVLPYKRMRHLRNFLFFQQLRLFKGLILAEWFYSSPNIKR